MEQLTQNAPSIIEQAARSPLGILALMILALSALGFFLFRSASERTRAIVFALMFVGVASFGAATVRSASRVLPPAADATAPTLRPSSVPKPRVEPAPGGTSSASPGRGAVAGPISIDRDNPTPLRSNEIRGTTACEGGRVRYYASFRGGPGEIKATLDFTSGGLAKAAQLTLFDEDFVKIARVGSILNAGGSERKVVRTQLVRQKTVIEELELECSDKGTFLVRVEGAVQFD